MRATFIFAILITPLVATNLSKISAKPLNARRYNRRQEASGRISGFGAGSGPNRFRLGDYDLDALSSNSYGVSTSAASSSGSSGSSSSSGSSASSAFAVAPALAASLVGGLVTDVTDAAKEATGSIGL